jgi:hypothetical protein
MKAGTAGGTLISILGNITMGDMLRTIILAAVGAVVSFSLSLLLKRWIKPSKDLSKCDPVIWRGLVLNIEFGGREEEHPTG